MPIETPEVGTTSPADDLSTTDQRGLAHNVDITKLDLTATNGEVVGLRAIFTELVINGSIFEYFMHGYVIVRDAWSLINRMPIVGEEYLDITYNTPGCAGKTFRFRVYAITSEEPDYKGAASAYKLDFCSPEVFNNATHLVAKAYANTDDAGSILKEIVTTYLKSTKTINTVTMKDPAKKLVIPNYTPFDAIDMLLRRGYEGNQSKSDYYLFFERSDGLWLKMFDDMVAQPMNRRDTGDAPTPGDVGGTPDTPTANQTWYVYGALKFQQDSITAKDIRRIINFQMHRRFNTLDKLNQGLYENEMVQYDIMGKKVSSVVYKYKDKGMKFLGGQASTSVSGVGGTGAEFTNTDQFIQEFDTPATGFAGEQAHKIMYRLLHEEEKTGVVKKGGGLFCSVKAALDSCQLTLTVPGDTLVEAGDIVNVEIPMFESIETQQQPDKFLSGKWIVGNIRDSILAPDKHLMVLDLFRDAYWQRPGAKDFPSANEGEGSD